MQRTSGLSSAKNHALNSLQVIVPAQAAAVSNHQPRNTARQTSVPPPSSSRTSMARCNSSGVSSSPMTSLIRAPSSLESILPESGHKTTQNVTKRPACCGAQVTYRHHQTLQTSCGFGQPGPMCHQHVSTWVEHPQPPTHTSSSLFSSSGLTSSLAAAGGTKQHVRPPGYGGAARDLVRIVQGHTTRQPPCHSTIRTYTQGNPCRL